MLRLEAQQLAKRYGGTTAVESFSHVFAPGKITAVLGPSGSGKSTLLALLAGLISPDAGRISLDAEEITALPAEKRDFGLVFQNYALFPHLTVEENVEFGLKAHHVPRVERKLQTQETLHLVRISHLAKRRIHEISGGEQQRVAIGRAIAFRPKVLLMDEPLSALDARLREELRGELSNLLRSLAITTIYVTHDQVEALSLGDELIVLRDGRIEQTGAPQDVYRKPATVFVARFLGAANVFAGESVLRGTAADVHLPFVRIEQARGSLSGPCWVIIRPADFEVVSDPALADFSASVNSSTFLGNSFRLHLTASGVPLVVETLSELNATPNAPVCVRVRPHRAVILPRT